MKLKLPKKFIIIPLLVLSLLGGSFWYYANSSQSSSPLEFVTVKREDLISTISTSGTLSGKDTADLHFQAPGKLAFINVKVGDTIQKGQVIAGLDTKDLSIALQQAQNDLRDKTAQLQQVYDNLQGHSSDETYAQKAERTDAEVAKDNAYDDVKRAQSDLDSAVITSPITGIVVKADPLPGQQVTPTDLIAHIVDFSQIVFSANVNQSDIGSINLGQNANVTFDAYGDKVFSGVVSEISPETQTTSTGASVVPVKISLNDPTIKKIDGLSGQVDIITADHPNALAIPQEALSNNNTVMVKTNQGVQPVSVASGIRTDTAVEVLSGLTEGETVVVNPNPDSPDQFGGLVRVFKGA